MIIPWLGLGTAALVDPQSPITEEQAVATVHAAFSAGIRMIDTAPLYGFGEVERRVGLALAELPRDDVVLATKVGNRVSPDGELIFAFDRDGVFRSVEESLHRLGTDRLDIVHVHERQSSEVMTTPELAAPLPALRELRDQGVIGSIGLGVNRWDIVVDLVRDRAVDHVMLAGRFNLLDRSASAEFLPMCTENGVTVIAAGVYATGILVAGPVAGATYRYREAPADILARTRVMAEICEQFGVPLSAAALHFPLTDPAVAMIAAGARSPEEVETMAADARRAIPAGLWEELAGHAVEGI